MAGIDALGFEHTTSSERYNVSGSDAVVIGVDTGGTFTDAFVSDGRVGKVPSTPADPVRAILHALSLVKSDSRLAVSHGTTVATNAVLERKGAHTGLITTVGFEDVLEIRRQNRPAIYDLWARWPEPLVPAERRLGVTERLDYQGHVVQPLDPTSVSRVAAQMQHESVESIAVCLLFGYANAAHEKEVAKTLLAEWNGELFMSLSHEIAPRYGEFERTSTVVVNAYVMPVMRRYLDSLQRHMDVGVRHLHVMHSNGGLVTARSAAARPVQTVLSGPAAGVVGSRAVAEIAGQHHIITFDMGGTSTDVAVVPGEVLEGAEGEVASFPLLLPMLTIETVGAGGGSIARLDPGGGLHVGPESAGADPGPAAYGRGLHPTVTDANLVLGRLSSAGLLGGTMPLDAARAREAVATIGQPLRLTVEQAAWAVIRLANSNMERAVRTATLQRGYDPRRFVLFPFGGAGPMHAAELADGLEISQVLVPPHPGVMAALGLTVPDLQRDFQRTLLMPLETSSEARVERVFAELEAQAGEDLEDEPLFGAAVLRRRLSVRYAGQSFELSVPYAASSAEVLSAFTRLHRERYGYAAIGRPVEIVHVRLRATLPRLHRPDLVPKWPEPERTECQREVWFGAGAGVTNVAPVTATVSWRPSLNRGDIVPGPALLEQYDTVTVIPPNWVARVDDSFSLLLTRE